MPAPGHPGVAPGAVAGQAGRRPPRPRCRGAPPCELVVVQTTGRRARPTSRSPQLGGQGAFVKEVQLAVLDGRADLAVHSAKDLPSETPPGLVLACVPERADPRDALVGRPPRGSGARAPPWPPGRCAAGPSWPGSAPTSPSATCAATWPPGSSGPAEVGAGVLALAALERLADRPGRRGARPRTPAPPGGPGGAGRRVPGRRRRPARSCSPPSTTRAAHAAVRAERAFLGALGGGCTLPLGALWPSTGRRRAATCRSTGSWPAATAGPAAPPA